MHHCLPQDSLTLSLHKHGRKSSATCFSSQVFCDVAALTQDEWARLLADFNRAKAVTVLLAQIKYDYWKRLPYLLCALAVCDENVARKYAFLIWDAWLVDPRKEAHHRRTWSLLQPGSAFLVGFILFRDGTLRADCGVVFLIEVAKLRFVPVCETTTEEKQKNIYLINRRSAVGPVRVSLANRLPKLERGLTKGTISGPMLVEAFEKARSLKKVPDMLGLQHSDTLKGAGGMRPGELRPLLGKTLYCCDVSGLHLSQEAAAKHNARVKGKAERRAAKLTKKRKAQRYSVNDVRLTMLRQRFAEVIEQSSWRNFWKLR